MQTIFYQFDQVMIYYRHFLVSFNSILRTKNGQNINLTFFNPNLTLEITFISLNSVSLPNIRY